jgi:hypothetical protein
MIDMMPSMFQYDGVLFGSAFADDTTLVVSDPTTSAVNLKVQAGRMTTVQAMATSFVPGQRAICWAVYSSFTDSAFLIDAGMGRLVEVDPSAGSSIVQTLDVSAHTNSTGMTDAAVFGPSLFALSPRMGTLVQVSSPRGRGSMSFKQALPFFTLPISIIGIAVA